MPAKNIKIYNTKLLFTLGLVVMSSFILGQDHLDGVWKSTFVTSYSSSDSGIRYTRIFLDIHGSDITLKNYDGIFKENEIFSNSGIIDEENNTLVFNPKTEKEKTYPILIDSTYISFVLNENPKNEIRFKKLGPYHLSDKQAELEHMLVSHFITGYFSYYDDSLGMEFYSDSSMIVTSSVSNDLSLLDKWAVISFGGELFLYLSDFGPMVHITNLSEKRIDFYDEYDQSYHGFFEFTEPVIKFKKEQLVGIWEQVESDTNGFNSFPKKMYDKDFYPVQTWELMEDKGVMYRAFFKLNTEWETSKNGEILFLRSINNSRFRILSVDNSKLIVERCDFYGEVYQDTFVRKKAPPKPTTLRKYFK